MPHALDAVADMQHATFQRLLRRQLWQHSFKDKVRTSHVDGTVVDRDWSAAKPLGPSCF